MSRTRKEEVPVFDPFSLVYPKGSCIVMGDGPNWNLCSFKGEPDILAVNRALVKYTGFVKYWASWHDLDDMVFTTMWNNRAVTGGGYPERVFSFHASRISEQVSMLCHGGSGLYGVLVALQFLGYTRIIVCNSPLSGEHENLRAGWDTAKSGLEECVRALDGYPAELLGTPTQEWLNNR